MAQIKLNATYGMTGTLPAVSGANLTTLNGSNISSGTVADARISTLTASKLTGALPAISGASLTTLNASNVSSGTLNAARYSGGKLLQTVQGTNSYQKANNTLSFVDIESSSGVAWETTITPSATSSKILISASIPINATGSGNTENRTYINLNGQVASGSYAVLVDFARTGTYSYDVASTSSTSTVASFNYLWTSNTTSACKVKFQFRSYNSTSCTVYVPALTTQTMVVILQEIGA